MGYVGLPLAVEFSRKINVIGFDINKKRISELKRNIDITKEVSKKDLLRSKKITFSNDPVSLKKCKIFIVTVPTPVDTKNKPDLRNLTRATNLISKILKKNDIVIYESTVFPGATEEICGSILERNSGFKINKDFFLGYSPERINPGDKKKRIN